MCFPDICNVLSSSDYACLHADKLNVSFPGGGGDTLNIYWWGCVGAHEKGGS